jgi:hypothetical protein
MFPKLLVLLGILTASRSRGAQALGNRAEPLLEQRIPALDLRCTIGEALPIIYLTK